MMTQQHSPREMRQFFVIWTGQLVSVLGSGLTSFALGVWVYQRTGSVTQFALISLFATLPGILFSPFAGALADRWDRRWVMILSDSGAGVCSLAIAALFLTGQLQIWHIYLATGLSAVFNTFQWPAYAASVALLVPKQQLGRANGMVQIAQAIAQLVTPALAGVLMLTLRLEGIILIDMLTFFFAVGTLLVSRIPRPVAAATPEAGRQSLLRDFGDGLSYLRVRPGLLAILLLFGASNLMIGVVSVLATPLVLSIASSTTLGLVISIGGSGMLAGSLLMSAWGGPKRRIYGMYGFMLLEGLAILAAGLQPSVPLFTAAAFAFFFALPIDAGCSQTIVQSKVPHSMQGRVFAVQRMIARSCMPLAYLMAGPLADRFEPLLASGGPLAGSVGLFIGVGQGRGIGLLFIVFGLCYVLLTLAGYAYPRLRLVEKELPDVAAEPEVQPQPVTEVVTEVASLQTIA